MTIQIQLTPDAELGLGMLARMKGLPLNEYVQGLLEPLSIPSIQGHGEMLPEKAADALHEWAAHFPYRRKTALPDEAIKRENLYRRDS